MFYSLKLSAQGYHAGDITYTWLYGYTYQIKLTTFTNVSGGIDPCQDTLCTGQLILRSNGPNTANCSGGHDGVAINLNIKWNEYITTHTYPGPGNYVFCSEEINRNPNIINIPGSVNQPMSLNSFLVIPAFGSGKNSAPVFANLPLANGCMNNGCFTYNPLATDADGDSLSYEILPCKSDSGLNTPGYSYPNAGASGTFSIDPVSGLLSWCSPQFWGDYNVVIKITEWRKDDAGTYFMVGYVERDTQLSISTCTGINELKESESSISVFPNPATEILTISFNQNNNESFTFELVDITGRPVKIPISNETVSSKNTIQLKLDNIHAGIYFLKITGSNTTNITKKIIKQ